MAFSFRSAKSLIISVCVATVTFAWAGAAFVLSGEYHNELSERTHGLERMRDMAAEQTRRMILVNDLFLSTLDHALTHDPAALGTPTEINKLFLDFIEQNGNLMQVGIIDRSGQFRRLGGSPNVDVSDRSYLAEAVPGRLMVSTPIRSRIDNRWLLPLVRRVSDPTNPTAVMLSSIDLTGLGRIYESFRDPDGGAITLLRLDGTVLARAPLSDGAVGQSIADDPLFLAHAGLDEVGITEGVSPFDGENRIAAFRLIKPYDIGIVVSVTTRAALAPWWQLAWTLLGALALVTALIIASTALGLRLFTRLETEAVTLERKVADRTAEIHTLMERRRLFLASMSHELRSPLNAILGFSDALLYGVKGALTAGQSSYIKDIHQAGGHLLEVVNDLLDTAALEAGSISLDRAPLDAARLVDDLLPMLTPYVDQAQVEVDARIDPPDLTLFGDSRRLLQVLLNLATNAIKYGADGGRVMIEAIGTPDGEVRLSVIDHGPGLSEEQIRLALTPFGRGETDRAIEGTGLGLPLCAGLVALHGGTMQIISRPGEGTRVDVLLPPSPAYSAGMSPSASKRAASAANDSSVPQRMASRSPLITS